MMDVWLFQGWFETMAHSEFLTDFLAEAFELIKKIL
jgi:hypothetical protein